MIKVLYKIQADDPVLNRVQDQYISVLNPIISQVAVFELALFMPGNPYDGSTLWIQKISQAVQFPSDFQGSSYFNGVNPTAAAYATIGFYRSGTLLVTGTVNVTKAGDATFTFPGFLSQPGDVIQIIAQPVADATWADIAMTLVGELVET